MLKDLSGGENSFFNLSSPVLNSESQTQISNPSNYKAPGNFPEALVMHFYFFAAARTFFALLL